MNSRIFKELSDREIERIVADLYGHDAKLTECRLMKGGMFNTTYYIATDINPDGIVLRAGPINRHLLCEFEKNMMAAEPMLHELLLSSDIPTSRVLKYSAANSVIDREYIVSQYIPSVPMNDPSLEGEDLSGVYRQIGEITRRLHGITNNKFGWKRSDGSGEYDTWREFIFAYAAEAMEKATAFELFKREDIDKFKDYLSKNADALDDIKTPYMVHGDLWQGNILLSKTEAGYFVAGVIDVERAMFGDKYWDMSTPLLMTSYFYAGYGEPEPVCPRHDKRMTIYKIVRDLFGCYALLVEYDDKEWYEDVKAHCAELLLKL